MYIRFSLPQGVDKYVLSWALSEIKLEIEHWAHKHGVRYTQKTIKHEHRLAFDDDNLYSLFSMTWRPESTTLDDVWFEWNLVNVAGEKY